MDSELDIDDEGPPGVEREPPPPGESDNECEHPPGVPYRPRKTSLPVLAPPGDSDYPIDQSEQSTKGSVLEQSQEVDDKIPDGDKVDAKGQESYMGGGYPMHDYMGHYDYMYQYPPEPYVDYSNYMNANGPVDYQQMGYAGYPGYALQLPEASTSSGKKKNPPLPPDNIPLLSNIPFPLKDESLQIKGKIKELEDDDNKYSSSQGCSSTTPSENTRPVAAKSKTNHQQPSKPVLPALGKEQARKRLLAFQMAKLASSGSRKDEQGNEQEDDGTAATSAHTPNVAAATNPNDEGKKRKMKGGKREDQLRATVASIEELKRQELNLIRARSNKRNFKDFDYSTIAPLLDESTNPLLAEMIRKERMKNRRRYGRNDRGFGRERDKRHRRSRSTSRDRKRQKSRHRDKDKDDDKEKKREKDKDSAVMPQSWSDFGNFGFKTFDDFKKLRFKTQSRKKSRNSEDTNLTKSEENENSKEIEEKEENYVSLETRRNEDVFGNKAQEFSKRKEKSKFSIFDTPRRQMTPLVVASEKLNKVFPESKLRFTRTKPRIVYCGNPNVVSARFDTRHDILEHAPDDILDILNFFLKGKRRCRVQRTEDISSEKHHADTVKFNEETEVQNIRVWYPQKEHLWLLCDDDDDKYEIIESGQNLNDSMAILEQLAREKSSTVVIEKPTVRSKWDSDYENDEETDLRDRHITDQVETITTKAEIVEKYPVESLRLFQKDPENNLKSRKSSTTKRVEDKIDSHLPQNNNDSDDDKINESSTESNYIGLDAETNAGTESSNPSKKNKHQNEEKMLKTSCKSDDGISDDDRHIQDTSKDLFNKMGSPPQANKGTALASEYEEFMKFVSTGNEVDVGKSETERLNEWEEEENLPKPNRKLRKEREMDWEEEDILSTKHYTIKNGREGSRASSLGKLVTKSKGLLLNLEQGEQELVPASRSTPERLSANESFSSGLPFSEDNLTLPLDLDQGLIKLKEKLNKEKSEKKKKKDKKKKIDQSSSESDTSSESDNEEITKDKKKKRKKKSASKKKERKTEASSSDSSDSEDSDDETVANAKRKKKKLKSKKEKKKLLKLQKKLEKKEKKKRKKLKNDEDEELDVKKSKDKSKIKDKSTKKKRRKKSKQSDSSSSDESEQNGSSSEDEKKLKKQKKKKPSKKKKKHQASSSSSSDSSSSEDSSSRSDSGSSSSKDEVPRKQKKIRGSKNKKADKRDGSKTKILQSDSDNLQKEILKSKIDISGIPDGNMLTEVQELIKDRIVMTPDERLVRVENLTEEARNKFEYDYNDGSKEKLVNRKDCFNMDKDRKKSKKGSIRTSVDKENKSALLTGGVASDKMAKKEKYTDKRGKDAHQFLKSSGSGHHRSRRDISSNERAGDDTFKTVDRHRKPRFGKDRWDVGEEFRSTPTLATESQEQVDGDGDNYSVDNMSIASSESFKVEDETVEPTAEPAEAAEADPAGLGDIPLPPHLTETESTLVTPPPIPSPIPPLVSSGPPVMVPVAPMMPMVPPVPPHMAYPVGYAVPPPNMPPTSGYCLGPPGTDNQSAMYSPAYGQKETSYARYTQAQMSHPAPDAGKIAPRKITVPSPASVPPPPGTEEVTIPKMPSPSPTPVLAPAPTPLEENAAKVTMSFGKKLKLTGSSQRVSTATLSLFEDEVVPKPKPFSELLATKETAKETVKDKDTVKEIESEEPKLTTVSDGRWKSFGTHEDEYIEKPLSEKSPESDHEEPNRELEKPRSPEEKERKEEEDDDKSETMSIRCASPEPEPPGVSDVVLPSDKVSEMGGYLAAAVPAPFQPNVPPPAIPTFLPSPSVLTDKPASPPKTVAPEEPDSIVKPLSVTFVKASSPGKEKALTATSTSVNPSPISSASLSTVSPSPSKFLPSTKFLPGQIPIAPPILLTDLIIPASLDRRPDESNMRVSPLKESKRRFEEQPDRKKMRERDRVPEREGEREWSREKDRDRERRGREHDRQRRDRRDEDRARRRRSKSPDRRKRRSRSRSRSRDRDRDKGRRRKERSPDRRRKRERSEERKRRSPPEKRRKGDRRRRTPSGSESGSGLSDSDDHSKTKPTIDDWGYDEMYHLASARTDEDLPYNSLGFEEQSRHFSSTDDLNVEYSSRNRYSEYTRNEYQADGLANSPEIGFRRSLADSTISDADLAKIRREGSSTATMSNMDFSIERPNAQEYLRGMVETGQYQETNAQSPQSQSPKRLSLDDRIELELGVRRSPPAAPQGAYIYQGYPSYPFTGYPPNVQTGGVASKPRVVQVGNVLQVVPTESPPIVPQPNTKAPLKIPALSAPTSNFRQQNSHQNLVVQSGNMLKIIPVASETATQASQCPSIPIPVPVPAPGSVNPQIVQVGNMIQVVPSHSTSSPALNKLSHPIMCPQSLFVSTPQKPLPISMPVPVPAPAPSSTSPVAPNTAPQSSLAIAAAAVAAAINANSPAESARDASLEMPTVPPKSITSLPFLPPDMVAAMEIEQRAQKRKDRELRKQQREERRREKQRRRQLKIQRAADRADSYKKALIQEGQLLRSDFDLEEIRVIEEAMGKSELMDEEETEISAGGVEEDDETAARKKRKFVPLPAAGKGILVLTGLRDRRLFGDGNFDKGWQSKEVKFADGVKPGEGTSPSAGEDLPSPPPPGKLAKEKRFKKKKKKKIKVQVVRQVAAEDDEDEDDNSSPPPPPPGSPPPSAYASYTANAGYMYAPPGYSVMTAGSAALFQYHSQQGVPPPVQEPSTQIKK